jgi:MEDS: MEthanogen/methylotroph, DcmR Sensory domain
LMPEARAYLVEGLERNEGLAYVSEGDPGELRHDLDGIPGLDEHLDRGRIQLLPFDSLQRGEPAAHPATELPLLAALARDAQKTGYRGLRIFANGTVRVRDPARRAQHVRYEHLIDRLCRKRALTMLCAYDRSWLGEDAVAELACVHPIARGGLSPFQLSADPRADLALAGSVDTFSAADLVTALQRIEVPAPGVQASIDLTSLRFIDHRALLTLDQYATRRRSTLVLRSPPHLVLRLTELIPLRAVRLEETT